ncbi:TonB-dependent receptor [Allostella vacuolata]|nr:TonB-dependent receptor [Stella vacuolata]
MSRPFRALCAAAAGACAIAVPQAAHAQLSLPGISVTADPPLPATGGSLTVPDTERATANIERTPGGVAVVPDTQFKSSPAQTIKDIVDYVPGIIVQPRYGDDARVSIRGSGLSRNYGNRGLNMYMDGIPIIISDGLVDLFEVDPSAYRYVEIYKGANALRYGGNALGGAINFVTPTGRDAKLVDGRFDVGGFGYFRAQASTGGVDGPLDWFVTGSAHRQDGFREHSEGNEQRASANFGYQFSPDVETRFYVNANRIRQRLPGEVRKESALKSPKAANPAFVLQDQARDIDSVRLANKTTLRFDSTTVDVGIFGVHRHVMHPIYQWLDYTVLDYGGFLRAEDDRSIGGFRNRLVAGINVHNGTIDTDQYLNVAGRKGTLASSTLDKTQNYSAYAENSFYVLPQVAVVAGAQFLHAVRDRDDRFLSDGDQSGRRAYDLFSPKLGVLWDVDPGWQAFANVSRSAEVPTFDANSFATPASSNLDAQTATTYEIGMRGRRPGLTWDVSLYRAEIKNELQCLTTSPFSACSVVNVDRTVHQGIELGLGVAFLQSVFAPEDRFWLNTAYTYNDFFFDGDALYGNNRLPGVPKHYVRSEVLYKHPGGFYVGPNVEWVPQSYYADNANTLKVDPYTLVGLKAGYDSGMGWSGYLEARNLFDKRYISSVAIAGVANPASEIFNPGSGRAIFAGVRVSW